MLWATVGSASTANRSRHPGAYKALIFRQKQTLTPEWATGL
ncbi:hypothetical protein EP7_001903 [Isosphaeraceae bacterium EP7]